MSDTPYEIVCHRFRRAVCHEVLDLAAGDALYRGLSERDRIAAILAGVSCALASLVLSLTEASSWDGLQSDVIVYMPSAFAAAREAVTRARAEFEGKTLQ